MATKKKSPLVAPIVPMAVVRVFSSWGVLYYIKLTALAVVGLLSYGLLHDVFRVWFDEDPLAFVSGSYVYVHAALVIAAGLFFVLQRRTSSREQKDITLLQDPSRKRAYQLTFWLALAFVISGAVWLLGSVFEMIYGVGFEQYDSSFWRVALSGVVGIKIAWMIMVYSFVEERRA